MIQTTTNLFTPRPLKTKSNLKNHHLYISLISPPNKLRPRRPVVKKVSSVSNLACSPSRANTPSKLKCKRSNSLLDLSSAQKKELTLKRNVLYGRREVKTMSDVSHSNREGYLAYKGYVGFLKNTLKKRVSVNEAQQAHSSSLSEQVKSMKIQITTLKSLLSSDEQVITNFAREIHFLKNQHSEAQKKIKGLESVKDSLEDSIERFKDEISQLRTQYLNEKNSYMLVKSEATALETQLQKEREKILKLKQEKKSLVNKASSLTELNQAKWKEVEEKTLKIREMEQQMQCQVDALEAVQEKMEESQKCLDTSKESISSLKKELQEALLREKTLNMELAEARTRIVEQCRNYETFRHQQAMEMMELEMAEVLSQPLPLKVRLCSVASYLIGFPVAVFEALTPRASSV